MCARVGLSLGASTIAHSKARWRLFCSSLQLPFGTAKFLSTAKRGYANLPGQGAKLSDLALQYPFPHPPLPFFASARHTASVVAGLTWTRNLIDVSAHCTDNGVIVPHGRILGDSSSTSRRVNRLFLSTQASRQLRRYVAGSTGLPVGALSARISRMGPLWAKADPRSPGGSMHAMMVR